MNSYPLTTLWLEILALMAIEVGLVALFFAAVQRWSRTAAWRRTLCQAALVTSLVIAFSELSGAERSFVARMFRSETDTTGATTSKNVVAANVGQFPENPHSAAQPLNVQPKFSAEVIRRFAKNQPNDSVSSEQAGNSLLSESRIANQRSLAADSTAILWLGLIWGIGTIVTTARACGGRMILFLLGTRRRACAPGALSDHVESLARTLRISRRVRIIESPRLMSPIAFGLIRPTIGLPLNFSGLPIAKQEAMLIHELTHLGAHDPFWYLLADLILAILWWHPGIWWLRRQLHLNSELAADEASLARPNGPKILAECLVEMGTQLAKPGLGQLQVAGFRSDLGCRVQRLMQLEGMGWRPISRGPAVLARTLGPLAVAGLLIFCTAWTVPQQLRKGDAMKTINKTWYHALAAFTALAAIDTPTLLARQDIPQPPAAGAASPRIPASGAQPSAQNAPTPPGQLERRYGLGLPVAPAPGAVNPFGLPGEPARGGKLEAKLREIVMDEVKFDGLPLSEVLKVLSDEARKRDPEKKGINLLLNPNAPQAQAATPPAVDPTTGLPLAAAPAEAIDISSVTVKFNIPLRHVTMADVLDAIVRVADHPIQYSVEDYAVIFSFRPEANLMPVAVARPVGPAPLAVRTFHVDTNTFVPGLESAFGIKVESKGKGESQSRKIQSALRDLLVQLNISMEGNKSIFYNELTGTVMVRLAPEDLDVAQAAIETLGGQLITMYGNGMALLPGAGTVMAPR